MDDVQSLLGILPRAILAIPALRSLHIMLNRMLVCHFPPLLSAFLLGEDAKRGDCKIKNQELLIPPSSLQIPLELCWDDSGLTCTLHTLVCVHGLCG